MDRPPPASRLTGLLYTDMFGLQRPEIDLQPVLIVEVMASNLLPLLTIFGDVDSIAPGVVVGRGAGIKHESGDGLLLRQIEFKPHARLLSRF